MELDPIIVMENATGKTYRAYFENERSSKDFAKSLSNLDITIMYDSYVKVGRYIDEQDGNKNKFVNLDEVLLYPAYGGTEIKTTYFADFAHKYSPVLTIEMASALNKLASQFC